MEFSGAINHDIGLAWATAAGVDQRTATVERIVQSRAAWRSRCR
jgi:hypothetical protein